MVNTDRLRELIALTGETQRSIAPKYQLHHSTLANYLAGRRSPSLDVMERIAAYHRVDVRGLLSDVTSDDEPVIATAQT